MNGEFRVMASGTFVAYYRVSTAKQGASGLGLEAQKTAVRDYLNGGSWRLAAEFTEIESGKRDDRPQLAKAIDACRLYGARLVIAKLDRLPLDFHFLTFLEHAGIQFVAADMPEANTGAMAFINAGEFSNRKSRLMAMGTGLDPRNSITDKAGNVLAYARTGGMLNPMRHELRSGA